MVGNKGPVESASGNKTWFDGTTTEVRCLISNSREYLIFIRMPENMKNKIASKDVLSSAWRNNPGRALYRGRKNKQGHGVLM